jgi:hypothetical protein
MSASNDLGPFAPLLVAVIVIAILVIQQPLNSTLHGISMNWVGAVVVAVGGVLGFLQ